MIAGYNVLTGQEEKVQYKEVQRATQTVRLSTVLQLYITLLHNLHHKTGRLGCSAV